MEIRQFWVTDFGAVSGVDAPQTDAIQAALDACFLAGGGEVVVPKDSTFVTGDIRIRSNTTLHLMENATLLGSRDVADYRHINRDKLQPLPEDQNIECLWYKPAEWEAMGGGFKVHLYAAGSNWNYGLIRAVFAENVTNNTVSSAVNIVRHNDMVAGIQKREHRHISSLSA